MQTGRIMFLGPLKPIQKKNKPIVAEVRSNNVLSGRIYYDCNTEQDIHYLAKVVFESTSLFQNTTHGKKTNKKLKPLDIEKDIDIIKAIVYGLFTRPRMTCTVKVDITEGACHGKQSTVCFRRFFAKNSNAKNTKKQAKGGTHSRTCRARQVKDYST